MITTSHMMLKNHFLNEKNHFIDIYYNKQLDNATLKDFIIQRRIGGGSFGTVALASHGKKQLAMKILEKQHIVKLKQIRHVINECHILGAIRCPFVVDLLFKFKDNANLYICLEFVGGGEVFIFLFQIIREAFFLMITKLSCRYQYDLFPLHSFDKKTYSSV
jgi:serine/threonine protein kinase